MSNLIVEVCSIEELKAHKGADRLEMARVKGWWCVVPKDKYKVGDKVSYFPPDSIITPELAERWGVVKYLGQLPKNGDGTRSPNLRVRAARFRGEASFGMIQDIEDPAWEVGKDLVPYYHIEKYEPPEETHSGDIEKPVEAFHDYTDIQNLANYPHVFEEGEMVAIDEKLHGTNCRVGLIQTFDENGLCDPANPTLACGSHNKRRKPVDSRGRDSVYWFPVWEKNPKSKNIKALLNYLYRDGDSYGGYPNVIIFGEIIGPGVQDMQYGLNQIAFRVFDISMNRRYIDYQEKIDLLNRFEIEAVPPLYVGPFSMEICSQLVDGPTTACDQEKIKEKFKGREGIVLRPLKERYHQRIGRTILKYVSADYHARKNKNSTENH